MPDTDLRGSIKNVSVSWTPIACFTGPSNILLKNKPCTEKTDPAIQTADDMLAQSHAVSLYLLQEGVRFCQPLADCSNTARLEELIAKHLQMNLLCPMMPSCAVSILPLLTHP